MNRIALLSRLSGRHGLAVAQAAALVLGAALPASPGAQAQAIFQNASTVQLTAFNDLIGPGGPQSQFDQQVYGFKEPGVSVSVRAALSPPGSRFQWLPFPNPSFPGGGVPPGYVWPEVFAGAEINPSGTGGVGVSGILQTLNRGDRGELSADAIFRSTIKNFGTVADDIVLTLQIPRIELAIVAKEGQDESAFVRGAMAIKHYDASGTLVNSFDLFEYEISFAANGLVDISEDLLADGGTVHEVGSVLCGGGCLGFRFDPFVANKVVENIAPQEWIEYEYRMTASLLFIGDPHLDGQDGGHAFFGDPLDIDGQASFVFPGLAAAPIPEPGAWALMLAGSLGLLAWRGRRGPRAP